MFFLLKTSHIQIITKLFPNKIFKLGILTDFTLISPRENNKSRPNILTETINWTQGSHDIASRALHLGYVTTKHPKNAFPTAKQITMLISLNTALITKSSSISTTCFFFLAVMFLISSILTHHGLFASNVKQDWSYTVLALFSLTPQGGGRGTPIHYLYRYVLLNGLMILKLLI